MLDSSPDLLVSAVPNFDDVHSTSKTSGNSGKRKEYGKREKCSSLAFDVDDVNRTNKTPVNYEKSEDCVKRKKTSIPRSNTVFRGSIRKPKVSPIPHKNENLPPLVVSRIAAPSFLSSTGNDLFGMSGLELLDSDVKKNRPRKFFKSRSIPHDRKEAKKTPWRPVMPKPKKARKPTKMSAYISSKCRKKDKSSRATTSQRKNLSTSDVTTSTSYKKDSSSVPIVTVDRASVCSKLDTFSIPVGGAMEREECVSVTGDAHILQHNEMLTEETDVTGLLDEAGRNEVQTLEQIELLLSWISAGMKVMQSSPGVDMQLVTEIKQMLIEIQRGL